MISLKAFGPVLAEALGTTPAAIYERQRALVRLGLLPAPVGRGRGNGLPASAGAVAMIIIAMMVTDNLSETDDRVRSVAEAEYLGRRIWKRGMIKPRCRLTGKRDFKSALVALLRMPDLPPHVSVEISRNFLYPVIKWLDAAKERFHESHFGGVHSSAGYLTVRAYLEDGALQSIGAALRQANDQHLDSENTMEGELL
jgi:hypothetical protein